MRHIQCGRWTAPLVLLIGLLIPLPPATCQVAGEQVRPVQRLLVRYRPGVMPERTFAAPVTHVNPLVPGLRLVTVPPWRNAAEMLREFRAQPDVLYAEPSYTRRISSSPNDPRFPEQWNLAGSSGANRYAGIHATDAWAITAGRADIVVAIVDTGVDHRHPDLAANIYHNATDCDADAVDSDHNGFVDDCFGGNALTHIGDALDDNGHGTAIAGIIGAVGNNATGIAGVNWNVTLLPCKALDADGAGTDADIIACFEYIAAAKDRGVNIVALCAAFGGPDRSQALEDAIAELRTRGILLIAAAGNDGTDNAVLPVYPANYSLANVVSVTATTATGALAAYSNFGVTTVHLAAPGDQVLTTGMAGDYLLTGGTSAAAAHVAGMAALLSAARPSDDWKQLRNRLLAGGDASPDTAATITGSHANVMGAINCANATLLAPRLPERTQVVTTVERGVTFSVFHVNCASPAGAPTIAISPDNVQLTLRDDGMSPDDVAGDGLYATSWIPPSPGQYSFQFSNGYSGTIFVSPYEWREEAFSYRDLDTQSATALTQSATIALPFPVSFAENAYASLLFDSRGLISFDDKTGVASHEALPTIHARTLVAPLWSELLPRSSSAMRYAVLDRAPQRELVLEWSDMGRQDCTSAQGLRFQVVWFENSADVLFAYSRTGFAGDCPDYDDGARATVGIQLDRDLAVTYSHDMPMLHDGLTLRWHANLPDNPLPAIASVQPDTWAVDRSPVPIVIRGSGFTPGSLVLWNAIPRGLTYISEHELYVMATAADLAAIATHQLAVFNALPGGGTSNAASFAVRAPDFTVRASVQSLNVTATRPGVFTLAVEPAPVFRGQIAFACSGLPAGLQCQFAPATIVPGTSPAQVTVTIAARQSSTSATRGPALWLWAHFGVAGIVFAGAAAKKRRRRFVLTLVIAVSLWFTSCGGASGPSAPASVPQATTVAALVSITASGSGLTRTQTVSVVYTN